MKLIAVSDLHLDINAKRKDPRFLEKLITYLEGLSADILVIAGDIGGNTQTLVEFFEASMNLSFDHKLYVPGNHDVWVHQDAEKLSLRKYEEILGEIASQYDFDYLPKNPLLLDNLAIVGTMGWYDYSSRNPIWDDKYSLDIYRSKKHPDVNLELMDRYFVKFGMSDEEVSTKMLEELQQDFSYIKRKISASEDITFLSISHMVPFAQFIPYRGIFRYDYFTAFFGCLPLGDLIMKETEGYQTHAIFGQCHVPLAKRINPQLHGYCVPIGYPREYGRNIDLQNLFQNRIMEIKI